MIYKIKKKKLACPLIIISLLDLHISHMYDLIKIKDQNTKNQIDPNKSKT